MTMAFFFLQNFAEDCVLRSLTGYLTSVFCFVCVSVRRAFARGASTCLCYRRRTARRDVSQNLVNCCTTVGTSYTRNPEQIEVTELRGYSQPTCNKLYASVR